MLLHYLEWGRRNAPPMLLLHGATGHARLWEAFAPASIEEVVERELTFLTGPSPGVSPELLARMAAYGTRRLPSGQLVYRYDRATIALRDDYAIRPYLSKIPCRVLIVRGAASPVLSRETAHAITRACSREELVEVASSGHMVMLDNPSGLARAVRTFLSGVPA